MIVFGLVLIVHILLSIFLIVIILLQGGRGGLGEALGGAAAQSLFGGSANIVMTKITAVCAALFMVTCLTLAVLSTARGRSIFEQLPAGTAETLPEPLADALAPTPPPVTATTREVTVTPARPGEREVAGGPATSEPAAQ